MATVADDLENEIDGFKACLGGEELRRASAALSGTTPGSTEETPVGSESPASSPFLGTLAWLSLETEQDPYIKDLLFAVKRYASLSRKNPDNFEAVYNYGLVLQELASRLKAEIETGRRLGKLERVMDVLSMACEKYEASVKLRPKFHAALYNWGVALSELAGLMRAKDPSKAVSFLHEASQRYSESLEGNPSNPQALNNWGLVLQEVSNYNPDLDLKLRMAIKAVDKFRRAIRLRPDFDHGCYNLGTIFYTHACSVRSHRQRSSSSEYQSATGSLLPALCAMVGGEKGGGEAVDILMTMAAQYIALAYALQPVKEVYQQSVKVVQSMLPKPYLRTGYLKAPRLSSASSAVESWEKQMFFLDHLALKSSMNIVRKGSTQHDSTVPSSVTTAELQSESYNIPVSDIVSADRCVELSLPGGHAFWVQTASQPQGIYLVAEDKESADCWVDALLLCHYISRQNRSNTLSSILATTGHISQKNSATQK